MAGFLVGNQLCKIVKLFTYRGLAHNFMEKRSECCVFRTRMAGGTEKRVQAWEFFNHIGCDCGENDFVFMRCENVVN